MTPTLILLTYLALVLITAATARAADPPTGSVIAREIVAVWTCENQLGVTPTRAGDPWQPHSRAYRVWQLNLWEGRRARCLHHLHARADALRTGRFDRLPDSDLYALAGQAVASGAIYSERWGDASSTLKRLCYEAVRRSFARFGTERWALNVVNRESGCNPGAVNTTYSSWRERAQCISQMIPRYHGWVDFDRCKRDLRYAVQVFVRLSDGGKSPGPWA